ncbi:MAG: acyl-CoA/acyl-ACP dehydrogenase [Bifidobacteriaceae bacterium]|jgi:alkylation response protein AidB-like acyl-CoA dehydrogenase|nr:acyl-CoA/acyl-ACP dehydrogenase [Bifidobacteriaceae bacterium]
MRKLTENQELIRSMAEEFTKTTVAAKTAEGTAVYAKTGQAPFSFDLWGEACELGYAGITVPERHGGLGLGMVEEMLVMEEISRVNASLATNFDAHNLALKTILYSGSDEQRERLLPDLASGKLIAAAAVTDPAGSSNFPEWSTKVEADGDGWVISATKHFCTNVIAADLYAVYTKSASGPGPMDCYLVPADSEGVEEGPLESFGRSGTNTGTLRLDRVKVAAENKIPPGDLYSAAWLSLGYLDFAAIMLGRTQTVFDKTVAFLKQRTRRGKPLAQLQAVAHRLANLACQIEQARSVAYDAAELWDAGTPNRMLHSIAKIAPSEMASTVSLQCVAMHGAAGMDPATGVLSAYLGAPSSWNGEYPNDLHRDMIAGDLGIDLESL